MSCPVKKVDTKIAALVLVNPFSKDKRVTNQKIQLLPNGSVDETS